MSALDEKKDMIHGIDHVEVNQLNNLNQGELHDSANNPQLLQEAAQAAEMQKSQTVGEALKMWPKAVLWSIIFSAAIIMEGYDTLLLGQFFAQPAFAERFGEWSEVGQKYEIPSRWQVGLGVSVQCGSIIGLQVTGWASERIGYRLTMLIALVALTGFLFIQFFAANIQMLLVGYLLLGFPWGTFQTMTVSYAAEVMPVRLRPIFTSYVNLCWVIGQILCSGVNRALINNQTALAYKIPFAIQWVWPVPIFIGIVFAPESPWWLVRKGRFDDAERALMRLTSRSSSYTEADARAQVALMHHTNEMEKEMKTGTSYAQCFKGTNFRRTEIACMVWLIQTICGSPLMGSATYFFRSAGMSPDTASTLNLIMFVVGGVGTVSSWWLMQPLGRRTLYLYGQVILMLLMAATGIMGVMKSTTGTQWAIGSMLIIFTFVYDISVGPVCYALVGEIGSTRLRSKTVVLARNLYNVGGVIVGIINPYMLNSTEWNWGPKSAFLWLGTGTLGLIWTFFRLPEPKGRTYGELDILFEQRVPARKFATTVVDEFEAAAREEGPKGYSAGGMVH